MFRKILGLLFLSFVLVALGSQAVFADQIQVSFSLSGNPDPFFSGNCNGGHPNCFSVDYSDPGTTKLFLEPGQASGLKSFGTFTASLFGNGGGETTQPFTLTIAQTKPEPDGEGPYFFTSTFTGHLTGNSSSNSLTLVFDTYSQTITGGGISVLYEIDPDYRTIEFGPNTDTKQILGSITASNEPTITTYNGVSAVPEPTSLILLGTGIGVIGLATWRRRKQ